MASIESFYQRAVARSEFGKAIRHATGTGTQRLQVQIPKPGRLSLRTKPKHEVRSRMTPPPAQIRHATGTGTQRLQVQIPKPGKPVRPVTGTGTQRLQVQIPKPGKPMIRTRIRKPRQRPTGTIKMRGAGPTQREIRENIRNNASARAQLVRSMITRQEYERKFGTDRDVTEPGPVKKPSAGVQIVATWNLNHEGRLRKNGKPCGHWAMVAYLVEVGGQRLLGVSFKDGFRCYYPNSSESEYHAIANSESGSYWCWDNGIRPRGRAYVRF